MEILTDEVGRANVGMIRKGLCLSAVGAVLLVGVDRFTDFNPLEQLGEAIEGALDALPVIDTGEQPIVVDASVAETRTEPLAVGIECPDDVLVAGIDVTTHISASFGLAGAKVDDRVYGSYLPCGNATELVERGTGTYDAENNVIAFEGEMPALTVVQPRVMTTYEGNCADVEPGDNQEETEEALAEWRERLRDAIENDETVRCEVVSFDLTGARVAEESTTEIISTALQSVEIALQLAVLPSTEQAQLFNDTLREKYIATLLRDHPHLTEDNITLMESTVSTRDLLTMRLGDAVDTLVGAGFDGVVMERRGEEDSDGRRQAILIVSRGEDKIRLRFHANLLVSVDDKDTFNEVASTLVEAAQQEILGTTNED